MSMQVRPGRVVDRATYEEAAHASGVAEGRAQALAEARRVVVVAFALLRTRVDADGLTAIDEAGKMLAEIDGWPS